MFHYYQTNILDIEKEREGKSYTYHTLLELHEREPDCGFYFLTGADSLEGLTTWYHWEDILDLCVFVVTTRPGYALEFSDDIRAVAEKSKGGILCVEIDALDVSSTEVRERVARGRTIADLIPQAIIEEERESMEIKVEGYKEILKNRLSVKRYTHSIGVANTAARLAGMFNGDIERAYLAGLMHDYARELTEEELQYIEKNLQKNGNVLVTNRASYDLVINHYVLTSSDGPNQSIYNLVKVCRQANIHKVYLLCL